MTPVERALSIAMRWTLAAAAIAIPALLVSVDDAVVGWSTWHLAGLVLFELALAVRIAPLAGEAGWFGQLTPFGSRLAAAASIVALVTGAAALVTIATSAGLRFDPSMQFLQLLSALDIAWVVTAAIVGAGWRWGRDVGVLAGAVIGVFCVWSIWRYLDTVGVGPDGEWIVDGSELMRLVLPNDMVAAVAAVALLYVGARYRTAHASDQS